MATYQDICLRADEFISYFEETWLVGNFSPHVWSVYKANSSSPRTNNHLEGWHINSTPKFFKLFEIMKQEQADTEVPIARLATGAQTPRREIKKYHKM